MRLFKAQPLYGETGSPPPPPHFSPDREATRLMPVYLNQYRDGRQRLPTPEKVAVMELSNSFERRRLGKHQQILNDISQRCREQEVSDMSGQLSVKLNLHRYERLGGREMTFYSTTFMDPRLRKVGAFPEVPQVTNPVSPVENDSKKQMFEKNYKSFPARRIMRQNSKFDFLKLEVGLPKLQTQAPKSSVSDSHIMRGKLFHRHTVNGPVHMDHYTSPRADMAPLVLPTVDHGHPGYTGHPGHPVHPIYPADPYPPHSERLDRMDTCFSTSRVTLGPRSKTQVSLGSNRPGGGASTAVKAEKPLGMPVFQHEMSQLQLTSGHSPPPNSVQEAEPAAS